VTSVVTPTPGVGKVITDEQGEPWWVAKDVANVLGISDPQTIIDRLDDDEHGSTMIIDALGREQKTSILSESGVYAAIGGSRKPAAKDFHRWLRKDVIPSIRRYGGTYSMSAPKSLTEAIRAMRRRKSTIGTSERGPSVNVIDERGRIMCISFGSPRQGS
jgi:prophage antirepressor-like protein